MNPILVDINWKYLLPLTFAKPVSHLLIGIDSLIEKWERHLNTTPGVLTPTYLSEAFPVIYNDGGVLINSAVIPTPALVDAIERLKQDQVLTHRGRFIAAVCDGSKFEKIAIRLQDKFKFVYSEFGNEEVFFNENVVFIESPADIFSFNDAILRTDFIEKTKNIHTIDFPSHVLTSGSDIYIHPTAKVHHSVLNAVEGPIYIGKDVEIMEGSLIRGPFSIGEGSTLKMGAKIYGATSIGAHCKVGGEVNNSVINDYSNKGHDGFLGNSVLGSWCNLGADTNTSNLKNNYSQVSSWNYAAEKPLPTGRLFHGLIMGDHSKAGINTMFNTGSMVGMCANIFDGGFPPKFVPSFSWGSPLNGFVNFDIEKSFNAARAMMARRGVEFTEKDEKIFHFVYNHDFTYR